MHNTNTICIPDRSMETLGSSSKCSLGSEVRSATSSSPLSHSLSRASNDLFTLRLAWHGVVANGLHGGLLTGSLAAVTRPTCTSGPSEESLDIAVTTTAKILGLGSGNKSRIIDEPRPGRALPLVSLFPARKTKPRGIPIGNSDTAAEKEEKGAEADAVEPNPSRQERQ